MPLDRRTRQRLEAELAAHLGKGRLRRAADVLRAMVARDPDDDRHFVKLAEVCLKLGDAEGARGALRGAAAAAERKGFYLRAMAALRQLARHLPPPERPWGQLATLALRLGLVGDALGFLDEGVRAWTVEGDRAAVLEALRRAHGLVPDDAGRALRLAQELRRGGRAVEATELLGGEARRQRAAGRLDGWLTLATELAEHAPGDGGLACEVAAALLERGEPRRALRWLQPHVREGAHQPDALRLLARAFGAMGLEGKRRVALRELARALDARGRRPEARGHWEALLAADPTDPEARRALGVGPAPAPTDPVLDLAVVGEEVLEPAPTAGAALADELAHLEFLVAHRFADEAREHLAALEAAHPGHAGLAALRARLDAGPERVPARRPRAAATALPPPPVLRARAAGVEPEAEAAGPATEPAADALARFREHLAQQISPDDAATHYDLGIACREMGLLAEAEAAFARAAAAPGPRAVDALVGQALCQAARGEPGLATRTLRLAMAHPAVTPVGLAAVLYELGALRERAGDATGAARSYRAAEAAQHRFRDAAARAARLDPGGEDGGAPALGLLPSRA